MIVPPFFFSLCFFFHFIIFYYCDKIKHNSNINIFFVSKAFFQNKAKRTIFELGCEAKQPCIILYFSLHNYIGLFFFNFKFK